MESRKAGSKPPPVSPFPAFHILLLPSPKSGTHELRAYVNPRTVPIYVLHGQDDDVTDVSSATQLVAALRENRVPHELHLVAANHYPITVEQLAGMVGWLRKVL